MAQNLKKNNLVVVRAGNESLHQGWLDQPFEGRSFELVVSYYSQEAYAHHVQQAGVRAMLVKGGKWDGLYQTLTAGDVDLALYEYIWLPDDDIKTDGATIEMIFSMARQYGLSVCQPSLTPESYFSHFLLMRCPSFRLRYTNYVEVMVPCLRREVLTQVLPLFKQTMSGFGLDYIWCRLPESGAFRCAVLDAVSVFHSRPVGVHLRSVIAAVGTTSKEEEYVLRDRFNIRETIVPLVYSAVAAEGLPLTGRYFLGWKMFWSWLLDLKSFRDQKQAARKAFQVLKRQLIKKLNLKILSNSSPQRLDAR